MPKGKRPPTLNECQTTARLDVQTWEQRQSRFKREQSLFYLDKPQAVSTEEVVVPNDPHYLTEKLARIIARLRHTIEVRPRDPQNSERAQLIENLLRQLWRDWTRMHSEGIANPLPYEQGKYMAQRGWLCTRLLLCSDKECKAPIHQTIHDPATVFPYQVGGKLVRVTHRYRASVDELRWDESLPEAEDALAPMGAENSQVWVYSQYWLYKGVYYHMVWSSGAIDITSQKTTDGDGYWLKKPKDIGYMPWVIDIPIGTPWRETEWDATKYIGHIGESFFTGMVGMYEQTRKTMTMMASILAGMANPPSALFLKDGQVAANQMSLKPGARMVFPEGTMQTFRVGAELGDIVTYFQMLQDRMQKSSFAQVMFGNSANMESGYMGDVLRAGNADVLYPYTACLEAHLVKCYEKSVAILGKFGPPTLEVYAKKAVNRPEGWFKLSALDLIEEDPIIEVHVGEMTLQEKLQIANAITMLVRDGVLSLVTARGQDWLDLEDPMLEDQRVIADMVKKDPDFIKTWIPLALMFTGADMENTIFGQLHGSEIAQRLMQGLMQGMMAPQPGAAPVQEPPGIDGAAMAPGIAQGGNPALANPQLLQLLQQMMGGAVGGGGQGGIPPDTTIPLPTVM